VRRNAVEVRNTQFRRDAETLVARMREALALGRPERTQGLVLLSFNAHLAATFLLNIGAFLAALGTVFSLSNNYAATLAASAAAFPFAFVGMRTLARDESMRKFGVVIAGGGLLAVAAILVSPQFFRVGLLEDSLVQSSSLLMGMQFLLVTVFFGWQWKKFITRTPTPDKAIGMRMIYSPWLTGLLFLSTMFYVAATWVILYRLTDSMAAVLTLAGVHLLVVGFCYVLYRKSLATPASPPSWLG
jgi:hypothetical protein